MTVDITRRRFLFKTKEFWFAPAPHDVEGADMAFFQAVDVNVDVPGFKRKESPTFVLDITKDLDTLWSGLSSGNGRKAIRRAERAGIVVLRNQGYEEFYRLYREVREHKQLHDPIPLNEIKQYGTLFVARYGGTIVSGHAYLEDDAHMRSWVIGSARFERGACDPAMVGNASKLIVWEAIKYAKEKGIRDFDFGGYNAGGIGKEIFQTPNRFKECFGGEVVMKYSYLKIYSQTYLRARDAYKKARMCVNMMRARARLF